MFNVALFDDVLVIFRTIKVEVLRTAKAEGLYKDVNRLTIINIIRLVASTI